MEFNTKLRFIVTSDIHYKVDEELEKERFEKGMKLAYDYASTCEYKNIDAFIAVGDFANCGSEGEMLKFKASLDKVIAPETKKVLTLASHEFKSGDGVEGAEKRLREIFGIEPDNYFTLKDCPFFCISTEDGCRIKEKKQDWLRECLKDAASKNRKVPFFVFQHPHLTDTVYGSINWGEDDIIAILADYPQVIDFSGHSHAPINDPRSIHQRFVTSLNTGSLSYFDLDEFDFMYGTVPPDCDECAQYYIVEVSTENAVKILPVDILTESFFNDGYIIETPWEPESFVFTDDRAAKEKAPEFSENALVDISVNDNKISITFPQAESENSRVNTYTAVIRNSLNEVILQKKVSSSYYLKNMPEKINITADFAFEEGNYQAEITAHGFWFAKSEKLITKFTV